MKMNLISTGIAERFLKVRQVKNLRQRELAEMLGVNPSYICDIEKERIRPSMSLVLKISEILNISFSWLLKGEGEMFADKDSYMYGPVISKKTSYKTNGLIPAYRIPILDTIPPSFPKTPIYDHIIDWVLIPESQKTPKLFALFVPDKSMCPLIDNGDIIVFLPSKQISSGQTAAFRLNGKVIIRKLLKKDKTTYLLSENDEYPPITVKKEDEFIIIGRAIHYIMKLSKSSYKSK